MAMFVKSLERIQLTVGVVCLSIFFIVILLQMLTRYLGISVIWTEEVATYSFIWAVFMGASVMLNRREHFNFDFLSHKLPGKSRVFLEIFIDFVLLLFHLALFYYGMVAVANFWNYTWVSLPMMKMGYVWISIPTMGLTMFIYTFVHLMRHLKDLGGKEVRE